MTAAEERLAERGVAERAAAEGCLVVYGLRNRASGRLHHKTWTTLREALEWARRTGYVEVCEASGQAPTVVRVPTPGFDGVPWEDWDVVACRLGRDLVGTWPAAPAKAVA